MICCPTTLCLSFKLPGIELPTSLTNKPNIQVKERYLYVYETILFCRRFILFQYTNVHLFAKFGFLKPKINKTQRLEIQACSNLKGCFWAWHRNNIAQQNCDFLSTRCPMNVHKSLWSTDCVAETWNIDLCFGNNHAKFEKNLVFPAIWIGLLLSLVRAIQSEANKATDCTKRDPFSCVLPIF